MAYSKVFSRRNWENEPSTATPLNETNLNVSDSALDIIDDRVVALDARATALEGYEPRVIEYAQQAETSKLNSEAYAVGKRDGVDVTSGDPTYHNNSKYYSEQAGASATTSITNKQNAEAFAVGQRDGVDVTSGDPTYHNNAKYYSEQASASATSSDSRAEDSEAWAVGKRDGTDVDSSDATYHNNSKYYSEQSASQVANSEAWANGQRNGVDVGSSDPAYHNNSKYFKEIADTRATASDASATEAESYAKGGTNSRTGEDTDNADYYRGLSALSATASADSATLSESWAVGGTNTRTGEDTNNAEYYSGLSDGRAEDAEAWAVGKRNGVNVGSTDDTYHNNAKYYAGLASTSETNAASSESNAEDSAEDSEAWAVGQRDGTDVPSTDPTYQNNAKYWAGQAAAVAHVDVMTGATDSTNGKSGLVPQPMAGDNKKALFGDGTFKLVEGMTWVSYIREGATEFSAGWLSATNGGTAFTPNTQDMYRVKTEGDYYNKIYSWNGTVYELVSGGMSDVEDVVEDLFLALSNGRVVDILCADDGTEIITDTGDNICATSDTLSADVIKYFTCAYYTGRALMGESLISIAHDIDNNILTANLNTGGSNNGNPNG